MASTLDRGEHRKSMLLAFLPPPSHHVVHSSLSSKPLVVHLQSTFHSTLHCQKGSYGNSAPPCNSGPFPSLPGAGRWPLHIWCAEHVQVSVVPSQGQCYSKHPLHSSRWEWTIYVGQFLPMFHTHLVQQALALLPPLCPVAKGKHCMFVKTRPLRCPWVTEDFGALQRSNEDYIHG